MMKIIKITLIILCMTLIFLFSSDTAEKSTKKSDGFIVKTCEFVLGRELTEKEKDVYIENLVFIVRKGAHFSIYLVLGLLIMSYFKEIYLVNKKGLLIAFFIFVLNESAIAFNRLLNSRHNLLARSLPSVYIRFLQL